MSGSKQSRLVQQPRDHQGPRPLLPGALHRQHTPSTSDPRQPTEEEAAKKREPHLLKGCFLEFTCITPACTPLARTEPHGPPGNRIYLSRAFITIEKGGNRFWGANWPLCHFTNIFARHLVVYPIFFSYCLVNV